MAQVINTNLFSLNAQRNLNASQGSLKTSLERLSSGLRINSAKDDAAGLAISERFTSQIRSLNQASRNANDGISLAQTAEGALREVTNNLQRIRELAVQSANATNTAADRASLDQEVQQRLAEVNRLATQTTLNGKNLLDSSFGNATFQVGANVGETISLGLNTSVQTKDIGKTADYVGASAYSSASAVGQQGTGVTTTNLTGSNLTIAVGTGTAVDVGAASAGTGAGQTAASAYAKVAAINAAGVGGLTATADTTVQAAFATVNASTTTNDTYTLKINDQAIYTAATTVLDGSTVASAINSNASATGVTAVFASGVMTLTAADGRDIKVAQTIGTAGTANEGLNGTATGTNNTVNAALNFNTAKDGVEVTKTAVGSIRLTSTEAITVGGTDAAKIGFAQTAYALGNSALNTASVTSVANANTTITRIDSALSSVSTLRSTFGAIQNRFDSTIANLATTTENLSAARSRIQDADFAMETAKLTRAQILQQAGTAMLAQANAVPQNVLALLR